MRAASLLVFIGVMLVSSISWGQDKLRLGARFGGNWSQMSAPSDPAGEPTLNSGAAYSGIGFQGGISTLLPIAKIDAGAWLVGIDILFARHYSSAEVSDNATGAKRVTDLQTTVFRVPLHAGFGFGRGAFGGRVTLGPELLMGVGSGSTISQENVEMTPDPLFTTPVTHVGLTAVFAADWAVGRFILPMEFRFTYDPMVPSTTVERFDGFENADNPGNFQVAHDVQFLFMLGVDYLISLSEP